MRVLLVMVDRSRHEVYHVKDHVAGEQISLSPTEYNILMTLTEQPNEVILYRQLYKDVWEQEDLGDVRTLMVHVSNTSGHGIGKGMSVYMEFQKNL